MGWLWNFAADAGVCGHKTIIIIVICWCLSPYLKAHITTLRLQRLIEVEGLAGSYSARG